VFYSIVKNLVHFPALSRALNIYIYSRAISKVSRPLWTVVKCYSHIGWLMAYSWSTGYASEDQVRPMGISHIWLHSCSSRLRCHSQWMTACDAVAQLVSVM